MLGAGNVLPMQVGGGPTPTEQAYAQLREAVGEGGSARDDSGIEGLWRWCRAKGLAVGASPERRAAIQAFPRFATDILPYYERVLQIVPAAGSTIAERAEAVSIRWHEKAVAATPDLALELQKLDPRLSLLEEPEERSITTHFGRAFEAHDEDAEGPRFNLESGRRYTELPNYSTRQVVRVRFTLGYPGAPSAADRLILLRAKKLLRRSIPSDTSFTISTGPWVLGVTPIGLGEVG